MTPELLEGLVKLAGGLGYYFAVIVAGYFGLKYGLKGTAEKLTEHIEQDRQSFAKVHEQTAKILDGITFLTARQAEQATSLALHDERTATTAARMERVEKSVNEISDKLTDLRIEEAKNR